VSAGVPALPRAEVPRRAWVEQIMGLPISIHVRGPGLSGETVTSAVAAVHASLREADAVFSTYRPDSQLSRLRRGELTPVDCAPEVAEVIDLCQEARECTGGWFDPWLPDADGERRFDPTGLVKGWAVERASRQLSVLADHDWLINAGGDVIASCKRDDTSPWRIGVEDPFDRSRFIEIVPVRTGAVATSGTAARGAHVFDPHTGKPATTLRSVTVTGPSLLWADVYATAGQASNAAFGWLGKVPGVRAVVVASDGTVTRLGR
jgi:thiamine biosynthesis lipoprotein